MRRWLRDWWTGVRLAWMVRRARRRLTQVEVDFEAATDRTERLQERLVGLQDEIRQELDEHRQLLRRSEEALEKSHVNVRVAEEMVKCLVAANKVVLDRYEADSAIQVQRKMASAVTELVE